YVRQTAHLLNLNGITGGNLLTGDATVPGAGGATNRYPWYNGGSSNEQLTQAFDDDEAWFGEATFSVTDRLDVIVGARVSDKTGGDSRLQPHGAFRTLDPAIRPQGDPFAGTVLSTTYDPDQPKINTYKYGVTYHPTDSMMIY